MLKHKDKILLRRINNLSDRHSYYWLDMEKDIMSFSVLETLSFTNSWHCLKKICLIGLYIQQYAHSDKKISLSFIDDIYANESLLNVWNGFFDPKHTRRIHYTKDSRGIKAAECFVDGVSFIADCIAEMDKLVTFGENGAAIRLHRIIEKLNIDKLAIYQAWGGRYNQAAKNAHYCIATHVPKFKFDFEPDVIFISKISRNDKIDLMQQAVKLYQMQKVVNGGSESQIVNSTGKNLATVAAENHVENIFSTQIKNIPTTPTNSNLFIGETQVKVQPITSNNPVEKEVVAVKKEDYKPNIATIKDDAVPVKDIKAVAKPIFSKPPVAPVVEKTIQPPVEPKVILEHTVEKPPQEKLVAPTKPDVISNNEKDNAEEQTQHKPKSIYEIAAQAVKNEPALTSMFDFSEWE